MSPNGNGENLGNAHGRVTIDASGVRTGMDQAKQIFRDGINSMTANVRQLADTTRDVGMAITQLTAPIVAFGATGIRTAMDFDDAMAEISARTGMVGEDLDEIADAAKQMGAETVFSSQQAAQAFLELLSSGQSAEEALSTLPHVLTAAAAGGIDLGVAADTVTDILASFQLEVGDAEMVVNALARAASSSSADISALQQGFSNVGPVANQFGLDVEDVAAVLAIFSENGIKGAEAGTQLRSMLMNMTRQTDAVTGAWDTLGISVYDADGNMRDLNDIMVDLNGVMESGTFTQEEMNKLLTDIGGSYGIMGLSALSAGMSIEEMQAMMAGQADATEVADARMNTFSGSINSLMGSIQTLQITALTPFMNDTLKPLVQQVTDVTNRVTAWAAENPELTKTIVSIGAGLSLLGPALIVLGQTLAFIAPAITLFGVGLAALLSPIGLVAAAVGGLAFYFRHEIWDAFNSVAGPAVDQLRIGLDAARDVLSYFVADVREFGINEAILGLFGQGSFDETGQSSLEGFLVRLGVDRDRAITIVDEMWGGITGVFDRVQTNIQRVIDAVSPLVTELIELFGNIASRIDFEQLAKIGLTILSFTSPIGIALNALRAFNVDLIGIFESVMAGATRFFAAINDGAGVFDALRATFGNTRFIDRLENAFNMIVGFINGQVIPAVQWMAQGLQAFFYTVILPGLGNLLDWFQLELWPGIRSVLFENILPLIQRFADFLSQLWDQVRPALTQLAQWFISDVLPQVGHIFNTVMALIGDVIVNTVIPAIGLFFDLLGQVWDLVSPALLALSGWFLETALPAVQRFISETFLPALQVFISTLKDIWAVVGPALLQLFDWFINTGLPIVKDFIYNTAVPAIDDLISGLKRIWDDVGPVIQNLVDWFETTGWPLIQGIINETIIPGVQSVIDILKNVWDAVGPVIQNLVDWFETTGWPLIQAVIDDIILPAVQSFIDLLTGIWGVVEAPLNSLKDGMMGVFNFIKDSVIQPVIDIINSVAGAVDDALGAIGDIKESVEGVMGDVGNLLDDANPFTGPGILSGLPIPSFDGGGQADANSIARVGRSQVGNEFFAVGDQGGTFYPDFARNLRDTMRSVMQSTAGTMVPAIAGGAGGSSNVNVHVNLQIPPELLNSPNVRENAQMFADTFGSRIADAIGRRGL